MCQLIFANLHSKIFNTSYLLIQAAVDARTLNKDGFGVTSQGYIWKTDLSADILYRVREPLSFISDAPVIGHVRMASTNNRLKMGREFSHPFESDNLILCHNGTLHSTILDEQRNLNKIDSQVFLLVLEDQYKKANGDMVKALNNAYMLFTGKFAFLIYEKPTGKYYAARGTTADLHFREFFIAEKSIGYVLNTQLPDLIGGSVIFENQYANITGHELDLVEHPSYNLEANSIFLLEETKVKRVGELKEKEWVEPNRNFIGYSPTQGGNTTTIMTRADRITEMLDEFLYTFSVDLDYLDLLVYLLFNHGILEITPEELVYLEVFMNELPVNENLTKEFVKISQEKGDWYIHDEKGLSFPYFLDKDVRKLREIRKCIKVKD